MFRIKPHIRQRCSEGSNKPCAHQNTETPTETKTELCLSISCGGTGSVDCHGDGALGAADLGVALALLEEVAINPTIEPPELTQDWRNRLLESFCVAEFY